MQLEISFVIYLILFRLAIIAAGVVSIILGYRLFTYGITSADKGSSMKTSVGGMKLELKNAAPGTFFAVFGVVVISVMLVSTPPGYESEQKSSVAADGVANKLAETSTRTIKMRAGENEVIALLEKGVEHQSGGDNDEAIFKYKQAIKLAESNYRLSELFNNLAWAYYDDKQNMESALYLTQMSNYLNPSTENYISTHVEILLHLGQKERALKILEAAIEEHSGLNSKLAEVRDM